MPLASGFACEALSLTMTPIRPIYLPPWLLLPGCLALRVHSSWTRMGTVAGQGQAFISLQQYLTFNGHESCCNDGCRADFRVKAQQPYCVPFIHVSASDVRRGRRSSGKLRLFWGTTAVCVAPLLALPCTERQQEVPEYRVASHSVATCPPLHVRSAPIMSCASLREYSFCDTL